MAFQKNCLRKKVTKLYLYGIMARYFRTQMSDRIQKDPLFILISGIGSSLIIVGMVAFTQFLWKHGIENDVFAYNISTAIFITDDLRLTTEAAPYALMSMNWFLAKVFEKEFRLWTKRRFV